MSRSDNNKNSIFDFAKTLLGQKPGGVCRVDERYDEYVIENSPTEEQLAAQRREDFSGMPVIAVAIAGLISGSYIIGLVAMVLGLFWLLTFNAFLGAIIVVLGWWIVGYRLSEKCAI